MISVACLLPVMDKNDVWKVKLKKINIANGMYTLFIIIIIN